MAHCVEDLEVCIIYVVGVAVGNERIKGRRLVAARAVETIESKDWRYR